MPIVITRDEGVWFLEECVHNGSFLIGLGGFEDFSGWFTHFIKRDGLRSSWDGWIDSYSK